MAAGQPVERSGPARWALERQARLVAGGIVLLAVVASVWLPGLSYLAGLYRRPGRAAAGGCGALVSSS